jgi:hypothetical protein
LVTAFLHGRHVGFGYGSAVHCHPLRKGSTGEGNGKRGNGQSRFNGHLNNLLKILYERAFARVDNEMITGSLQ